MTSILSRADLIGVRNQGFTGTGERIQDQWLFFFSDGWGAMMMTMGFKGENRRENPATASCAQ